MGSIEISNTISKEEITICAEALKEAEVTGLQIPTLTSKFPQMTIRDAYLIQDEWVKMKLDGGRNVVGHKVGLTSKVMQEAFGIDEPDFGVLLDDMVHMSGTSLQISNFIEPRIEIELAFILSDDINAANPTAQEILDAVDHVIPAMELIDFRTIGDDPNHKRTVKDTIADNAANAAIIMGDHHIPKNEALEWVSAVLRKNDEVVHTGVASAVLGHPLNSMKWLIKKYAGLNRSLKKDQIVLAGSFTAPIPVKAGDKIVADFNQFGKVTCSFD